MKCDICHIGHDPEDLHQQDIYGEKFIICTSCKEEIEAKRVRP